MNCIFRHVVAWLVTIIALCIPFSLANAALIKIEFADATNDINFFAEASVEDTDTDQVAIEISIESPINEGLTEGDILAFFFDLDDLFDTSTLVASNFQPTDIQTTTISTPGTLSGAGNNGTLSWDVGIQTGKGGGGEGKNQFVSFDLMGDGLSTATFGTRYGLRVQSISGTIYNFDGDSSKLTGTGGTPPPPPPTPVSSPATIGLLGIGLIGMTFVRRKKSGQV